MSVPAAKRPGSSVREATRRPGLHRAAALLLGSAASLALVPLGCTSGDDPCVTMIQHIEDCDALDETQSSNLQGLNCSDPQATCVADCISAAPCKQVKDLGGPKGQPIQDCMNGCTGM